MKRGCDDDDDEEEEEEEEEEDYEHPMTSRIIVTSKSYPPSSRRDSRDGRDGAERSWWRCALVGEAHRLQ
jgi:hypothetical protein